MASSVCWALCGRASGRWVEGTQGLGSSWQSLLSHDDVRSLLLHTRRARQEEEMRALRSIISDDEAGGVLPAAGPRVPLGTEAGAGRAAAGGRRARAGAGTTSAAGEGPMSLGYAGRTARAALCVRTRVCAGRSARVSGGWR
jgi:hypothetical protein